MAAPVLPPLFYEELLRRALAEDLGTAGDLTTDSVIPATAQARARIVARAAGRIAGLAPALAVFPLLSPAVGSEALVSDGDDVAAGATLATLAGPARALLTGERTALNLLGRLSGIATAARDLGAQLAGTRARLAGTRKTTPGLRALEKHALVCGGATPHRAGLHDAVLIKDNHLAVAGGVGEAVRRARAGVGHLVKIEVEVDDLDQLREALAAGADVILLDNMPPALLREAVAIAGGRVPLEASGGVRPETIRAIAESGVDLISVGWLTHSAPALDVALDFEPSPAAGVESGA
ncbi:MAG: carboxylating nicotinate-nucleotide diphosphorylase [Thermoanaerobaculia bacterium]|nr:carboxylating nicotinate-nucleotide diphosphorylase [Thermoanaerobaculia bacterium]MBP7812994.1 carboxylating nicotinate-nucleotide diphosphorylase [Thermoanaerobaculia bacterium]MBP8845490.1 carboxylating nicotinate-nucleotide diphosphorylase [Thermoanaerobaculia bacterium]HPA96347.1 carboxylating nicotinate-nucleotide diphosphorylase [Thermoanaerobaculia bacterium]HRR12804.1 carboxylating nicotinate-nucleotide diphosphorylase [Thermoanaerobaculia bacterium]